MDCWVASHYWLLWSVIFSMCLHFQGYVLRVGLAPLLECVHVHTYEKIAEGFPQWPWEYRVSLVVGRLAHWSVLGNPWHGFSVSSSGSTQLFVVEIFISIFKVINEELIIEK